MKKILIGLLLLTPIISKAALGNFIGEMPSAFGSPKIPVLLVQFQDVTFSEEQPLACFTKRLCGRTTQEAVENGEGTAEQYFADQSQGLFTPEFIVMGPVTLHQGYAYYGADNEKGRDPNMGTLINEALNKVSSQYPEMDWSIYDSDTDGIIDALYIIYAGEGQHAKPQQPDLLWPHTYTFKELGAESIKIQGLSFNSYSCTNELQNDRIDGIGVFCHEFCHQLGLPDFYRTDGASMTEYAMGSWSVMESGNYALNGKRPVGLRALEKLHLGWIEAVTLTNAVTVENWKSTDKGAPALKIENSITPSEYYLLETIDGTGWNKSCPSTGMLVTHVHLSGTDIWYNNTLNNASPYRVQIIPADNDKLRSTSSVDEYEAGAAGDTYPSPSGNDELTDNSIPAATLQVGLIRKMRKPITHIVYNETTGGISFDFMGGSTENILTSIGKTLQRISPPYIYSIDGNRIINNGQPLRKGIYIINRQKKIIK